MSPPPRDARRSGEPIDIGHGVTIQFVRSPGAEAAGIEDTHPSAKDGTPCMNWIPFAGREHGCDLTGWKVESEEPLTLSPSLLCRICGHHGFIRNGQWVPA
jgi:hypothetical protein